MFMTEQALAQFQATDGWKVGIDGSITVIAIGHAQASCRAGLASDPGGVTWDKGCRQYVSGQQSDSLQTRSWQPGLALFRPWWSVPYHLKKS
jgi:hypothetical protein